MNIEGIDHSKQLLKVEIPSKQAETRKQYEISRKLWPCHFHEDKRLEAILGKKLPEVWGDKAFQTHCTNMQRLLSSNCFLEGNSNKSGHKGTVLVFSLD